MQLSVVRTAVYLKGRSKHLVGYNGVLKLCSVFVSNEVPWQLEMVCKARSRVHAL